MENPNVESSEGFAKWVGMSVASAFFASLERCSCVNLTTFESDDEDTEDPKGRPFMFTNSQRSSPVSPSTAPPPNSVTNLPV